MHGDRDFYFPVEHPRALAAATGPSADLWIIKGMGHAETGMTPALMQDIGRWIRASVAGLDGVGLDGVGLDGVGLDGVGLDGVGLDGVGLDGVGLDAVDGGPAVDGITPAAERPDPVGP